MTHHLILCSVTAACDVAVECDITAEFYGTAVCDLPAAYDITAACYVAVECDTTRVANSCSRNSGRFFGVLGDSGSL